MPERSLAFARMRRALLTEVVRIPRGKVVEIAEVGQALNIPPRHVAYMLARLTEDEVELVPWHRVVPRGGRFTKATERVEHQLRLLASEGLRHDGTRQLVLTPADFWQLGDTHRSTFWADEP